MKTKKYIDIQWELFKLLLFAGVTLFLWTQRDQAWMREIFTAVIVVFSIIVTLYLFRKIYFYVTLSSDVKRWQRMMELDSREFEFFVGELFQLRRFEVEYTRSVADHGFDLVLYRKQVSGNYARYLCEVKQYTSNKIGEDKIRNFMGALDMAGVRRGVYVTTSAYTRHAIELAQDKNITLIDGTDLTEWIAELSKKEFLGVLKRAEKHVF